MLIILVIIQFMKEKNETDSRGFAVCTLRH
jgi:hypothetical protein